jgi:hypothetical protein
MAFVTVVALLLCTPLASADMVVDVVPGISIYGEQFEQEAKEAKKGLWTDPNPMPPWLYRRLETGGLPIA